MGEQRDHLLLDSRELDRSPLLFRARKVHKAQLAETVYRVPWGSLVQLALWVPLEKMEIR